MRARPGGREPRPSSVPARTPGPARRYSSPAVAEPPDDSDADARPARVDAPTTEPAVVAPLRPVPDADDIATEPISDAVAAEIAALDRAAADRDRADPQLTAEDETVEIGGPSEIPRGTSIAGYVVLGSVGAPSADPVLAAFDPERNCRVAIRLFAVPGDEPEIAAERLTMVDSLRALSRLSHPNILQIFDAGVWEGSVYAVMEYFDGIDLREWIEARDEPFPWREVVRVFGAIGRGLAAAHAAGVVHRDLGPDAVLMGRDGQVKLGEFGLCDIYEDPEDAPLGAVERLAEALGIEAPADGIGRTIFGTVEYAAPEVLAGAPADARSDQYALCVALYEALYGERPFAGSNRAALSGEVLARELRPAPPGSDVPSWLRDVVLRGLSLRAADRWPSVEQLLRELDRDPAASRRRWLRGGLVLGAALAIAGVIVFRVQQTAVKCTSQDRLVGIWDGERRDALAKAFVPAAGGWEPENWKATADTVDAWVGEWSRLRAEACQATRVLGEASEELYLQRRTCLDARLDELSATLGVFESADASTLARAPFVTEALTRARACTHPEALANDAGSPEADPAQLAEVRTRTQQVWTWLALDRADTAAALLVDLQRSAEGVRHPGLEVDVQRLAGQIAAAQGRRDEAESLLHAAARRAGRDRLDYGLVRGWTALARLITDDGGREREAIAWVEYADAIASRIHDDDLRWPLLLLRAELDASAARPSEALARRHAVIDELARNAAPIEARAHADLALGDLMIARGEAEAALRSYSIADQRLSVWVGPRHPARAEPLQRIGDAQARLGQLDEARASWDQALALLEAAHGVGAPEVAQAALAIAERLRNAGDAESALAYNRKAVSNGEAMRSRAPELLGRGLVEQARTLLALERDRAARDPLERASELLEADHLGAQRDGDAALRRDAAARLADAQALLARALWSDGDQRARATELARRARGLYVAAGMPSDPWLERAVLAVDEVPP